VANALKPESWPVAEDSNWKSWKFKEIISDAMEAENLRLRKEMTNFENRFNDQERLHKAVISELETERAHKATTQKTLEAAYTIIKSRDKEIRELKRALRALSRDRDHLKNCLRQFRGSHASAMDIKSGICLQEDVDHYLAPSASAASMSLIKAIAFDGEENTKPRTSCMIIPFLFH
jgi:predicted RNase H-like nuclease (RuvC/YqgF family)